jgi:hypothetical protein
MTYLHAQSLRPAITTNIGVYNASATCDIIPRSSNLHIGACHCLKSCLPAVFSRTHLGGKHLEYVPSSSSYIQSSQSLHWTS